MVSELVVIAAVTPIKAPEMKTVINVIVKVINRNVQKFREHALKNPENENFSFIPRLLNKPPVKKAFMRNAISIMIRKPDLSDDIIDLKTGPRSMNVSRSNPSASLSVIMLLPKEDFKAPLNGMNIKDARIRKNNQISKTPFHDLRVREKPELIELQIFINTVLK